MCKSICAVLMLLCFAVSAYAERPGYFTLSTARTYSPDEKPKLHLYTRNEDTLEFRVYRVALDVVAGAPFLSRSVEL
jgi:hypothetical protein